MTRPPAITIFDPFFCLYSYSNKLLHVCGGSSKITGIHQPKSATASTGGGHTAERAELEEITLSKAADLASPILMQHCAMGKTIPKAKFEFMRADGNGQPIKYFEIELENVLIGSISPGISAGTILGEHMSLKFSKVKWKYSQQKIAGGTGGSTLGGWDLSTNRVA